ncbi:MAG: DUF916 domain-containing protein [Candidatus Shapirobacteria bacterium]
MTPATKKTLKTFLLALGFLLLNSHSVLGQVTSGLTAIPPRLEGLDVKPGEVKSRQIKVRNDSAAERFISVKVKDFIVTNDLGTPIQLEDSQAKDNRWSASSWIQISQTRLRLKPGETKSLTLTVVTPDNALPGGHYAMVLYTPDNSGTISGTGSSVEPNVGSLVYITVAGKITENAIVKEFTAPSFLEFGPVDFKTIVRNLSDTHIKPVGSINIQNWLGTKTASLPLTETNIFPYTNRDFTNTLDKKWLFGRYKAQFLAAYGTNGQTLNAVLFFWVIPWRLLILILALIIVLILLSLLLKKSPGQPKTKIDQLQKELTDLKDKYKDKK